MSTLIKEQQIASTDNWTDVGDFNELFNESNCYGTVVNGVKIGLFNIAGKVYALDDMCTHGNARLSEGEIYDFEIECPLHAGAFDVRDGKALCAPLTRGTRTHEVRLEGNRVFVKVESK